MKHGQIIGYSTIHVFITSAQVFWRQPPNVSDPEHYITPGINSHNQNQLRIWGKEVLNDDIAITPYYSLKYWCEVQRRMTCLSECFGDRVLLVNFDRLCQHNDDELAQLMSFIGQEESKHEKFSRLIKTPGSIGRYKNEDLGQFDPKDIEFFNNTFFNV